MTNPILIDEAGPIRYDWPQIKLLYVAGAGVTDLARSLTIDQPDEFDRVRAAVAQRAHREEWLEIRDAGLKMTQNRPEGSKNNVSALERPLSQNVQILAQNIFAERKKLYIERTTGFIDRASKRLEERKVATLEDAAMAAKLFEPVHAIARDVHGLNAKEGTHNLQVNILSDWAGKLPG